MSYMAGNVKLGLDSGRVVAEFSKSNVIDPNTKAFIDQQVNMMNTLFDLFKANELQV